MEAVLRGDINSRDAAKDDYMQNVHVTVTQVTT
jgi:hypothetical protein